jgi:hypothetical protein
MVKINCIMKGFMICITQQILNYCQIKKDGWAKHVACVGDKLSAYRVLTRKPENRLFARPWGGSIILKWLLTKYDEVVWTGLIWLRTGTCVGLL